MKKLVYVLVVFSTLSLTAQEEKDPLRFFPHAVGNRWEYGYPNSSEVGVISIDRDSVDEEGNVYVTHRRGLYKIQKDGRIYLYSRWYYENDGIFGLEYDFTAPLLSVWRRSPESRYVGYVSLAYTAFFYGRERDVVMVTLCRLVNPADTQSCIGGYQHVFAEGIGLVEESIIETEEVQSYLRGAIIDGDTIGTITSVENGAPSQSCLYPNPAAEYIMVSIEPSSHGKLRIAFSDYLGRESFVLYDGEPPSEGKLLLDLRAIPSGCYLCRISAGSRTTAHPVTIVR